MKAILFITPLAMFLLWTGCTTPTSPEVPMPPRPPVHRIESTISPRKEVKESLKSEDEPEVEPEVNTEDIGVAVPQPDAGVQLELDGQPVELEDLRDHEDPSSKTVIVIAKPQTPYKAVEEMLETLHDMGFLVDFKADK